MVSSSPNTASAPSGSSATSEMIEGPALFPNVPSNGGDTAADTRDVVAAWRLPLAFSVNVNSPISGGVSRFSPSMMVMTSVDGLTKVPE